MVVCVAGATSKLAYGVLHMLACASVFRPMHLVLLDGQEMQSALEGLKMDFEDMCCSHVCAVTTATDALESLSAADLVCVLADDMEPYLRVLGGLNKLERTTLLLRQSAADFVSKLPALQSKANIAVAIGARGLQAQAFIAKRVSGRYARPEMHVGGGAVSGIVMHGPIDLLQVDFSQATIHGAGAIVGPAHQTLVSAVFDNQESLQTHLTSRATASQQVRLLWSRFLKAPH